MSSCTQPLDLTTAECHFLWRPEQASTKTNLEQLIDRIQLHLDADHEASPVYLTTLSYLFTLPPFPDFSKADEFLEKAENFPEADDSSKFVSAAMRLHIRQMRRGRSFRQQEISSELKHLGDLWSSSAVRAGVYGMKGATLRFFGPLKYPEGVEAFRLALQELSRENFRWVWGQAYLQARIYRQQKVHPSVKLNEHYLNLWRRAHRIACQEGIRHPVFYANYAEAILGPESLVASCEELMDVAVQMLKELDPSEMGKYPVVFIIGLKVYRLLRVSAKYDNLLKLAGDIERCCKDSGFHLEISRQYLKNGDRQKALEALRNGKQCAMHPGHVWIDLDLIELEAADVGVEKTLKAFDSLTASNYKVYSRIVGAIRLRKAAFLFDLGNLDEAMEECFMSIEAFPDAALNLEGRKIAKMRAIIEKWENRDEYLAWFMYNISCAADSQYKQDDLDRMEDLYHNALVRDKRNHFVWKHLGILYLKQKLYRLAVDCFRQLSHANDEDRFARDTLISDAIVNDPKAELDSIEECLLLGCQAACLRLFECLTNVKSDLLDRILSATDASDKDANLLFFSRRVYELCARVDVLMKDSEGADESGLAIDIRERIKGLLELGSLSAAGSLPDRGNLMRHFRLKASRLYVMGSEHLQDCKNYIVLTIKEAKELLDRCFAYQFRSCNSHEFAYVHAFDRMKSKLKCDPDYNKKEKEQRSKADLKALEAEALMDLIRRSPELRTIESVSESLHNGLKKIDPNFSQSDLTRRKFDFLAKREHRILNQENRWIVRWIYGVNAEKHRGEMLVTELEKQLASDWTGWDGCRTGYDLAHLAAEFAEETWLVLGPDRCPEGALSSGTGDESAGGEETAAGSHDDASSDSTESLCSIAGLLDFGF